MKELTLRQKEIINASIGLISNGGIQNLSMRNISEKLEISEPAIYRHFKNKLEVLITILNYFEQETFKLFNELEKLNTNNIDKLKFIFLTRCKQFSENPEFAKVIFAEEIFQNESILAKKVSQIMNLNQKNIMKILEEAQLKDEIRKDIEINHLAIMILGSLRLLVTKWRLSEFNFDLIKESKSVWNSLNKVLSK